MLSLFTPALRLSCSFLQCPVQCAGFILADNIFCLLKLNKMVLLKIVSKNTYRLHRRHEECSTWISSWFGLNIKFQSKQEKNPSEIPWKERETPCTCTASHKLYWQKLLSFKAITIFMTRMTSLFILQNRDFLVIFLDQGAITFTSSQSQPRNAVSCSHLTYKFISILNWRAL